MNLYSKLWKNLSRQPCVTLFSSCGTYYISYWNWKCCLLIIKMKLLLVYVCVYVYSWQATYVCHVTTTRAYNTQFYHFYISFLHSFMYYNTYEHPTRDSKHYPFQLCAMNAFWCVCVCMRNFAKMSHFVKRGKYAKIHRHTNSNVHASMTCLINLWSRIILIFVCVCVCKCILFRTFDHSACMYMESWCDINSLLWE